MILVVIIIFEVKTKRKISTIATAIIQAVNNKTHVPKLKKDKTVTEPVSAKQENIYDNPEHSTSSTYDQPTSPSDNSTNSVENLLAEKDQQYDIPKVTKTTSSLSLMHRKESKSRYEQLLTVEGPGEDP